MMFLMMILQTAFAADYEYDVDFLVPLNAPPASLGVVGGGGYLYTIDDAVGAPDAVIQSTWTPMTCVIESNKVSVRIAGDNSSWPTSLPIPAEAICSATFDGDTYELTVNLSQGPDVAWGDGFVDWQSGFEIEAETGVGTMTSQMLPTGYTYIEGSDHLYFNPSTQWDDAWCGVKVNASGYYWLYVHMDDSASTDSAMCKIQVVGNPIPTLIPVEFTRL